jgi:hypothetical protein
VCDLRSKPVAARQPKKSAQPKVGICRDRTLPRNDLADSLGGYIDLLGQPILAQVHRLKKLLEEEFSGRNWVEFFHRVSSVVVDDLDIFRSRILPAKADTPLIVDPDAELPGTLPFQGFQTIAWRHLEVIQAHRNLELPQLAARHIGNAVESPNSIAPSKRLSIVAFEGSDHAS